MAKNTVLDVLEAISDTKSAELFSDIAKGTIASKLLKEKKDMSKKQYYHRMRKFLNIGLVKRVRGKFFLTNFGVVVYHAMEIVETGVGNYWKLKAIDSIQGSEQIGESERMKLIKSILNDKTIESILVKG